MDIEISENWNNLILCTSNTRRTYLFEITKYKKFNKKTFLEYLKNSSFTFDSQKISLNILIFLEKNKIFDGNNFNEIYHFDNKYVYVYINKKRVNLKKYQIAWRFLHLYTLRYYKKLLPFERKILEKNFINKNGFTENLNIEYALNPEIFNLPKTRVDLLVKLKNKTIVIEFNEDSHKLREKCSLKEEERNLALANGALMKNNNLECIRFIWESILYSDNKKIIFYNFLDSIKNKIIMNCINKEDYIIEKINYYFGEGFKLGKIIYESYLNKNKFKIKINKLVKELKLITKNSSNKLKKIIINEQKDIIKYLKKEKEKYNTSNIEETLDIESFSDSDDDSDDNFEFTDYLYILNNNINFNGMIVFLKNISIANDFNIIDVYNAQKLLNNIFTNFIKAHEDLYDEVTSNSEFIKHFE